MSTFMDIQAAVVSRLEACSEFRGVPVLQRLKGNVLNDITAKLNQLGICVFVFPPLPSRTNPNIQGPYIDEAEIVVQVLEKQILNQTSENAYTLTEAIMRRLHLWEVNAERAGKLVIDERPMKDRSKADLLVFDISFRLPIALPQGNDQ